MSSCCSCSLTSSSIYSKQEFSRGQNEGNSEGRRCRCRMRVRPPTCCCQHFTPNFLEKQQNQKHSLDGWQAHMVLLLVCLQGFKDCFFLSLFYFFHCILVYLERMGQFFKCLITLWWYSLLLKYSPHKV